MISWGLSWGGSWGNSWGSDAPPPVVLDTSGGFDEHHYKKYREYLERLTNIAKKKEPEQSAQEIVEIVEALPDAPEVPIIEQAVQVSFDDIDLSKYYGEINQIIAYIELLLMYEARELEDEEAIVLLM